MNRTLMFLAANPRLLGFGIATAFLSSFGQTYVISLYGGEIRSAFDLSHGDFGAIYAAGTLTSAAVLIWAGRKIDDIDLRAYTLVIGFGLAFACAMMAATQNPLWLIVSIFLLRFTGQGLLSHTSTATMARYFDADRGKALSIAGMGYSVGEAAFPVAVVGIIAWLGWRGAWGASAVIVMIATIPIAFWLLGNQKERHRKHLDQLADDVVSGRRLAGWSRIQMLRDPRFYILMPSFTAPPAISTGLFFHQIHLVEIKGWDITAFAASYSIFAVACVAAVVATGWLVDRLSAWSLIRVYLAPMVAAALVITGFDDPLAIIAYMIVLGIGSGIVRVIHSAIWAEVYGVSHIGSIKALTAALMVVGSAIGPVVMGLMIDAGISFEEVALWCAGYMVLCAALTCFTRGPASRPPPD